MGGLEANPSYENIKDYAEALWIEYDPSEVSYETLLQAWTKMHTPKTQSHQYRSVVWYLTNDQKQIATKIVNEWKQRVSSHHPLFTSIESGVDLKFYQAEEYHQDHYLKTGQARFVS